MAPEGTGYLGLEPYDVYWSRVRDMYTPFENGMKSGTARVFDHQIPGKSLAGDVRYVSYVESKFPIHCGRNRKRSSFASTPSLCTFFFSRVWDSIYRIYVSFFPVYTF